MEDRQRRINRSICWQAFPLTKLIQHMCRNFKSFFIHTILFTNIPVFTISMQYSTTSAQHWRKSSGPFIPYTSCLKWLSVQWSSLLNSTYNQKQLESLNMMKHLRPTLKFWMLLTWKQNHAVFCITIHTCALGLHTHNHIVFYT